ncbi:PREDICTED: POM121-like protein 12-like [Elephantulus edwardii]|uniref:POM121-like protein 12-like n=1 Tax=Elephantulus edwardii TaxID=28737 RepID=UPI0003F0C2F3|nr:PREDICTED: POM121-like protein 12-like [Elephantulus edwardii]
MVFDQPATLMLLAGCRSSHRAHRATSMGSSLSSYVPWLRPETAQPPRHEVGPQWEPKPFLCYTAHVCPGRWRRCRSFHQLPGRLEQYPLQDMLVLEAWRCSRYKRNPYAPVREDYLKHWLFSIHNPRRLSSPVTVKIRPPERRQHPQAAQAIQASQAQGSLYTMSTLPAPQPDPCSREVVLQALQRCNKGKRKFDKPLWFEDPQDKKERYRQKNVGTAFKPVVVNGMVRPFVPKPGPLNSCPSKWSCRICENVSVSPPAPQACLDAPRDAPQATPQATPQAAPTSICY